jgi:uncharacterized membrane protein YfcA
MILGVLFVLQLLVALAALPVLVMSLMTSKRWRSRQHRLRVAAVGLIILALLGVMVTLVVANDPDDSDYWLALSTPFVTFVLASLTIWRSTRRAPHGTGQRIRSGAVPR